MSRGKQQADWTFAEDTIHVWMAKGECTFDQFEADTCQYLTQSRVSRPKPRILSLSASRASAESRSGGFLEASSRR